MYPDETKCSQIYRNVSEEFWHKLNILTSDANKKSYNDAFQMIPTIGTLHNNMKNACLKNIGNRSGETNQTFEMESTCPI